MKISNEEEYATRALIFLGNSKEGATFSLKEIAENEYLPLPFLEKIFSKLKSKEIVKAKRGAHGGYILGRPPESISIREIFSALSDNISLHSCSSEYCNPTCHVLPFWKKLENIMNTTLENTTLKDLLK